MTARKLHSFWKTALTGAAVVSASAIVASAADKVTYNDHVLPIFRNACLNCHNPDKKKAGLDLSTYTAALQGSENGKVLQSGNAGASQLFKCIKQIEDPKMPPKGEKLNDQDIATIEKWIIGQLLETATGKAVAVANNNVQVAVVSLEKPDGPPPMPGELPLDPVVHTRASNALIALAVSPWAPVVAVGGQKQIILYNTETLELLGVLPFPEGFPSIIKFSRNGQLLLTGGGLGGKSGRVALWDIKTGERVGVVGNEVDQVLAADLTADQQHVALGGPNKLVKVYSTKDGQLVASIKKHTDWVTAIAYSPDGRFLATADRNGGIQVWEGAQAKEYNALPGHKAAVTGLAFMTGVLASSSEDGKIALWDIKEAKEIRSWAAHGGGAAWVDFTPDGRLVSCGRDRIAKVWDQNGKELGKTQPFDDITLRAALNSERIVAGDWTGKIRVSAIDGKPLGELSANPPTLADRLVDTTKRLADAQAALAPLQQQLTVAEQKLAAEKAALEAAKAAQVQLEKRLADETAQIDPLTQAIAAAADPEKPAAQQKLDAQKNQVAATQAELAKVKAELAAKMGAPAPNPVAELQQKLDALNAEIAKRRAARGTKAQGTPEYVAADALVQGIKPDIEKATAALAAAQAAPPAPAAPKPSPTEEEVAKARAAFDQASAQIAALNKDLGRWKLAQVFQTVHNSRRVLAEKQAQYDGLVQAAKEAFAPVEKTNADITAAEKTVADAPADLKAKEAAIAEARAALDPIVKTVSTAEATIADKTKELAALTEAAKKAVPNPDELAKKLEGLNAEIAKRREFRGTKQQGTPEYAEADAKVQELKPEIAQVQAAIEGAKSAKPNLETPEIKAVMAEIAKAKDTLQGTQPNVKAATDKVAAAEKALAAAKATAEQAAKQVVELRAKLPEITKAAETAKVEAERGAAAAEKELVAAKAETDKRRAEYEAAKAGSGKTNTAAATAPGA
ncbi:MAG TPA: c-type cytochrome domain-containing protein [Chthoniobacteraceae bacterium]|jgi:hypothetical protein|nr:c-type cytochrome domain-containing protein [Chthoniobacteraceae bacterium]